MFFINAAGFIQQVSECLIEAIHLLFQVDSFFEVLREMVVACFFLSPTPKPILLLHHS